MTLFVCFPVLKPLVGCKFVKLPDVTPSPEPRYRHVAWVLGYEIFVYGGVGMGNLYNEDVWVYNMKTSSWKQQKTKNDIPKCVFGSTACLNNNQIFLFGGFNYDEKEQYSNDVHSLDLDTWEWTKHTTSGNKPSGRSEHVLWTITNKIIVFGGYGTNSFLNDTYHLNTHTMKWTQLSTTGTTPPARIGWAHAQCAG